MSDQFQRKVADMFAMAFAGDIEPDHIFPVILYEWAWEEITQNELLDLHGEARVVREIDREVRSLEGRLKGKEQPHPQILKSLVQQLIDKTWNRFGEVNAHILEGRIKRDLDLTDDFEKRA